jgi:hypothetical protein
LLPCTGADDRDRTGDLVITNDVLCQLSYIGMERETGIEPATNSLEGCDSTTELLPPVRHRHPRGTRPATAPSRRPPCLCSLTYYPERTVDEPLTRTLTAWKGGGQGRIRTSVAHGTADLQSAAIDRSATCPKISSIDC